MATFSRGCGSVGLVWTLSLGSICGVAPGAAAGTTGPPLESEIEAGAPRAFDLLSRQTPRIFLVGRGRQGTLVLRNQGTLTWSSDEGYYVSYGWLSLGGDPVEDVRRVRTPLPRPVAPGGSVTVHVEVLPPATAGIYRLQWDMLQERVQWFSSTISHPRYRAIVLVLPRWEHWLGVGLPGLVALLGLIMVVRHRRDDPSVRLQPFVARADVWWVTAAVVGKPWLLYAEIGWWPSLSSHWTTVSIIAAAWLMLYPWNQRVRPLISWWGSALVGLIVWSQILHHRFFEELISISAAQAAGQTGKLGESIRFLSRPGDLWMVADLVVAVPLVWVVRRMRPAALLRRERGRLVVALLLLTAIVGFWQLWRISEWEDGARGPRVRTLRAARRYGLGGYQVLDLFSEIRRRWLRPALRPEELAAVEAWLDEQATARRGRGPWFGVARGKSLLAIQVESLQQFVIGLEIAGQEVTPRLNRFREESVEFPFMQDQTGSGRSAAGEFAAWTSLIPTASSVAHEYPENRYTTPAHVLVDRGYRALSAMPFVRSFWNRHRTYPALGFSDGLWEEDFEVGERVGWGLNDLDFLRQMSARIVALARPFLVWLTTLSLHYPYEDFPADLMTLDLGELEGTPLGHYLHGMHLFDQAFGELLDDLESTGLLRETVVAVWGDHDSGLLRPRDPPPLLGLDDSWPEHLYLDRVPFLVRVPGKVGPTGTVETWAGQIDIAPTLLALFGEDPARFAFVGRNLLMDALEPTPVVYPNGSWIDGRLLFVDGEESFENGTCWSLERRRRIERRWCRQGYEQARAQLEVSATILVNDLQEEFSRRLHREGG